MADAGGEGPGGGEAREPGADGAAENEFGWQGWLLLAAVAIALVVVPLIIYLRPPGLPFVVAYLVLPLVPAVVLALVAVWVTTRP